MENHLKEINAVLGVVGSFVCLPDATIAARELPAAFDAASVETAARAATQTFNALDSSGQRILEADLIYAQGRLVMKNLRGGILVIVCARSINIPLLNLTANVVAKKIAAEFKPKTVPAPRPVPAHATAGAAAQTIAPAPAAASPSTPALATPSVPPTHTTLQSTTVPATQIAPSSLYVELENEAQRLQAAAKNSRITLCAMDPIALWACCSETRQWVSQPQKRHIEFCAPLEQAPVITRVFDHLGYELNQRFNSVHGNERLRFDDPPGHLSAEIYLDTFVMFHRLDLKPLLASGATILPETYLVLLRLQLVEITDPDLGDLCALFLEHKLTHSPEKESINETQISRLCADDWGWYKTVKMNLDRLIEFADNHLAPTARDTVATRARQIRSGIEVAPKSLRWLARAGIGEGVRWYETPQSAGLTTRPDLSLG